MFYFETRWDIWWADSRMPIDVHCRSCWCDLHAEPLQHEYEMHGHASHASVVESVLMDNATMPPVSATLDIKSSIIIEFSVVFCTNTTSTCTTRYTPDGL